MKFLYDSVELMKIEIFELRDTQGYWHLVVDVNTTNPANYVPNNPGLLEVLSDIRQFAHTQMQLYCESQNKS